MRGFDDYLAEMPVSTLSDGDIELLLSGAIPDSDEAGQLVVFVDLIRAEGAIGSPPGTTVARVAREAALAAGSAALPDAETGDRRVRPRAGWRLRPQLAVAAAAVLLVSVSGVAVAANGAAPGDALYGIDRALEKIGIGDGQAEERLDEANALLSEGEVEVALRHATNALQDVAEAPTRSNDAENARVALEDAAGNLANDGDSNMVKVKANVSNLIDYLRANIGERVGDDGKDFGQGVADLARAISPGPGTSPPGNPPNENEKKQEQQGSVSQGGGSGNGGGTGGNEAPGNSGEAPGQQKKS